MRTNEPDTVTLTIRLPEKVKHSLQEKAKADDLTLSQLVRRQLAAAAAATITLPKPDKKA